MRKILYLTPVLSYPSIQGHQVMAYNRIVSLSKNEDNYVTLVCFYDDKIGYRTLIEKLSIYNVNVIGIYLPKYKSILRLLKSIISENPFQVSYYYDDQMSKVLNNQFLSDFDVIHCSTLRMAQYCIDYSHKVLLDLIDSMTLNISSRLSKEKFVKKIFYKIEYHKIKKYEEKLVAAFPFITVVGTKDKLAIGNDEKIIEIPLGINTEKFFQYSELSLDKRIIFTGNMSYTPNIVAVQWFLSNCWDIVKSRVPEASFYIVGANPNKNILSLHGTKGIIVLPNVESIADELNKARVAVAPMQIGSGMQNKILEAMACSLPVITTPLGLGSIQASNNVDIIVSDEPLDYAECCISLLENYDKCRSIGTKGHNLVIEKYSNGVQIKRLVSFYDSIIKLK
ncbi:glycosyltransferase [Siphonobacter curvatus]|uniref:Glycosyltransferase n=1 Tax=Siphonobacter curvatus TaxID=2094562 RepID=A0A2S7IKW5_9BACT|nr:glycosyltransferase [Siphonobacter curvatus]PQA58315.1 hypothetical protein C5O19_01160 [Siphonobacter curvatus]